jgi:hypothetical protein
MVWQVVAAAATAALAPAVNLYASRDSLIVQDQNVTFPSDLGTKNAFIHMRFSKYRRRSIYDQPFFEPINSIRLPIPNDLIDNISVEYSNENLGPIVGAAADGVAGVLGSSGPGNVAGNLLSGILGATPAAIGAYGLTRLPDLVAAGTAAVTRIPGGETAANILSAATRGQAQNAVNAAQALSGITFNPFQVVLFKSPNFKKHKFSWTMVPKDEKESRDLDFILKLFKYHMLPGISGPTTGAVYFSYPEILEIKLYPKDEYLYKFKPCVVDSVSVNYAPNGPSFYKNTSAPTAVNFTINLQEIEIWTKADYVREDGRPRAAISPNLRIR